jgi:Mg-chelatase subunit ChlD
MKPIANTILVQDVSGSMNESLHGRLTKLEALKQANMLLLEHKRRNFPKDRLGCVLFNDSARLLFDLTEPQDPKIERHLSLMQASGQTNMNDGLQMAIDILTKRPGRFLRNIILLSDGFANVGYTSRLIPIAQQAGRSGITINTIGFGRTPKDFDETLLKSISRSSRRGQYLHVNDLRPLASALVNLS